MEIEAKKCTLGKRKGSNQHRFVDCCLLSFPRFVHPTVYITIKGLYTLYFKIHHWVDKMVVPKFRKFYPTRPLPLLYPSASDIQFCYAPETSI